MHVYKTTYSFKELMVTTVLAVIVGFVACGLCTLHKYARLEPIFLSTFVWIFSFLHFLYHRRSWVYVELLLLGSSEGLAVEERRAPWSQYSFNILIVYTLQ